MSVIKEARKRIRFSRPQLLAAASVAILGVALLHGAALAQGPFGVGPAPSAPPEAASGLIGWLLRQQALYYREFTAMIRAARQSGGIAYGLLGLSFTYGVFHAAGPGHGKAVISSYLFANGESWRRGVTLSFASALLQALVAIAVVGVAAVVLGGTAKMMGDTVRNVEIASYLLVIAVGLRLTWVKGRALFGEWRQRHGTDVHGHGYAAHDLHAAHVHHDHEHHDHHHCHGHRDHHDCAHHHYGIAHEHDHHCGHAHGPQPEDLAGPGGWRRGLSAVVAAGLRPCSGAIIVLVFCLAQGIFWTGVGATLAMGLGTAIMVAALASLAVGARAIAARLAAYQKSSSLLILRAVELCAALAVILIGVLLLTGYIASERMMMV
jgi:nickel/cobalt transporter (NicO) family protein